MPTQLPEVVVTAPRLVKRDIIPIKLHPDNPYLDALIEISPLGDVRDIYEGVTQGDPRQSVEGLIGLSGTVLGVGLLNSIRKLHKLNKLMKTSKSSIDQFKYYNERKKLIPKITSTGAGMGIDGVFDARSIYDIFNKK